MILLVSTAAAIALFALAFVLLFGRLLSRVEDSQDLAEWLEGFSVESYRPMERLLNVSDFRFLESQRGYQAAIGRQLRAERKKIFRAYLRQLTGDFRRLVKIARLMMIYSEQDRPDLVRAIASAQRQFYWNLFCAETSLVIPLPNVSAHVDCLIDAMAGVYCKVPVMVGSAVAEY